MTRTWEGPLCDAGLLTDDIHDTLRIAQPLIELKASWHAESTLKSSVANCGKRERIKPKLGVRVRFFKVEKHGGGDATPMRQILPWIHQTSFYFPPMDTAGLHFPVSFVFGEPM